MALSCIISEIKRDIDRKSWFFRTPIHSTPPLGGFPSAYFNHVWYVKLEWWDYPTVRKTLSICIMYNRSDRIPAYDRQTDGRTDWRTRCLSFILAALSLSLCEWLQALMSIMAVIMSRLANMADVWANSIACHPRATCTLQGAATGLIQRHVIPEPRISLQGAATWWIHCHDSSATCHIAGCSHLAKSMSWSCHIAEFNNSIRHIENRFSPYFIFFVF